MLRSLVGSEMCIRDSPQQALKEQAADSMLTMLRPGGGQIFNLAAVCPPKRPSA